MSILLLLLLHEANGGDLSKRIQPAYGQVIATGWLAGCYSPCELPTCLMDCHRSIDRFAADRQTEILIRIDILSKARVEKGKGELQESVDGGEYIYWNRLQIIMSIFVELCVNNNKG